MANVIPLKGIYTAGDSTAIGELVSGDTISKSWLDILGIEALTDPAADRIMFWDDSETKVDWLSAGNGLTITATSIAVDTASETVDGIVELATAAEVTAGTDAGRAICPDQFAGSVYGKRVLQIKVLDDATALTTGDGKIIFVISSELNGYNLVDADAFVTTVATGATLINVDIRNVTDSTDMLSTNITIDASEFTSYTAATQPVINATYDDVATGDRIAVDIDAIGNTTPGQGLGVILSFQLP